MSDTHADAGHAVTIPPILDATTRLALRDAALAAFAVARSEGVSVLRFDGREVRTVDAAGLGTLVMLQKRATDLGMRLVLTAPSPALRQIIEITRLTELFPAQ